MNPARSLDAAAVAELPEGTPVTVLWSGGNGPWNYIITVSKWGHRYAWSEERDERMRFYNPLEYVGEYPLTQVWLR